MHISHFPGSIAHGAAYGSCIKGVSGADGGSHELTITDLVPGKVGRGCRFVFASVSSCSTRRKHFPQEDAVLTCGMPLTPIDVRRTLVT